MHRNAQWNAPCTKSLKFDARKSTNNSKIFPARKKPGDRLKNEEYLSQQRSKQHKVALATMRNRRGLHLSTGKQRGLHRSAGKAGMTRGQWRRESGVTVAARRVQNLNRSLRAPAQSPFRIRPARASESCGWCWAGARQCPHLRTGEAEQGPARLRQGLTAQPQSAARCDPGPARWPAPA